MTGSGRDLRFFFSFFRRSSVTLNKRVVTRSRNSPVGRAGTALRTGHTGYGGSSAEEAGRRRAVGPASDEGKEAGGEQYRREG